MTGYHPDYSFLESLGITFARRRLPDADLRRGELRDDAARRLSRREPSAADSRPGAGSSRTAAFTRGRSRSTSPASGPSRSSSRRFTGRPKNDRVDRRSSVRNRTVRNVLASLAIVMAAAASAAAQTPDVSAQPIKATVDQLAWIAGAWKGTLNDRTIEQTWSAPLGGSMLAMYRSVRDNKVTLYSSSPSSPRATAWRCGSSTSRQDRSGQPGSQGRGGESRPREARWQDGCLPGRCTRDLQQPRSLDVDHHRRTPARRQDRRNRVQVQGRRRNAPCPCGSAGHDRPRLMPSRTEHELIVVDGREVAVSNPHKVLFPQAGYTKLDLVRYYLAVADGALRARRRPAERARPLSRTASTASSSIRSARPQSRPDWIEVVDAAVSRPGRTRRRSRAARRGGARVDGQPRLPRAASASGARRRSRSSRRAARRSRSGARRARGRRCARSRASCAPRSTTSASSAGRRRRARAASTSTCASSRRWTFDEVRRAALALAREVERRAPALATSKWWKEERHGVFLDYNQNAKDRTVAARTRCGRRPTRACRRRSTWDEVDACEPGDFTLATMPARFAEVGDRHAGIDEHAVLARAAARAVGAARARGARRRAVAAALPEAAGRAAARAAVDAGACRSIR